MKHGYDSTLQSPAERLSLMHEGELRLRRLSLPAGGLLISGVPQFDQSLDLHLSDNEKIFFGDDDDTSIYFDGTNWLFEGVAGAAVVFNEAGADVDFRVESDNFEGMLYAEAGRDHFGVGNFSSSDLPEKLVHLKGDADLRLEQDTSVSAANLVQFEFVVDGTHVAEMQWARSEAQFGFGVGSSFNALQMHLVLKSSSITLNDAAADIDVAIKGDTATSLFKTDAGLDAVQMTPSTTRASASGAIWDGITFPAATATITGTTQITTSTGFNLINIARPTLTDSSSVTVDIATTLYIAGQPIADGSVTIAAPRALWVDNGISRFDGDVQIGFIQDLSGTTVISVSATVLTLGPSSHVDLASDLRFNVGKSITVGVTDYITFPSGLVTMNVTLDAPSIRIDEIRGSSFVDAALLTFSSGQSVIFNEGGHAYDFRFEGENDEELIHLDGSADAVGFGIAGPLAKVHIDQTSSSGAKPVLSLDQGDIDDTFINYIGTSAADGTRSISSDTTEDSTKFGAVRCEINGTTKWIRIYDDES